jgi:hypothetical protein
MLGRIIITALHDATTQPEDEDDPPRRARRARLRRYFGESALFVDTRQPRYSILSFRSSFRRYSTTALLFLGWI